MSPDAYPGQLKTTMALLPKTHQPAGKAGLSPTSVVPFIPLGLRNYHHTIVTKVSPDPDAVLNNEHRGRQEPSSYPIKFHLARGPGEICYSRRSSWI